MEIDPLWPFISSLPSLRRSSKVDNDGGANIHTLICMLPPPPPPFFCLCFFNLYFIPLFFFFFLLLLLCFFFTKTTMMTRKGVFCCSFSSRCHLVFLWSLFVAHPISNCNFNAIHDTINTTYSTLMDETTKFTSQMSWSMTFCVGKITFFCIDITVVICFCVVLLKCLVHYCDVYCVAKDKCHCLFSTWDDDVIVITSLIWKWNVVTYCYKLVSVLLLLQAKWIFFLSGCCCRKFVAIQWEGSIVKNYFAQG